MNEVRARRRKLDDEVAGDYLTANRTVYAVSLLTVCALEIYMILLTLIRWASGSPYRAAYLSLYLILLLCSAGLCALLLHNGKRKNYLLLLVKLNHVYNAVFLLWGAAVSFLDVRRGKTLIVFLTVAVMSAAIMNLKPVFYCPAVGALSVALLVLFRSFGDPVLQKTGYLFNVFVFLVFSNLLVLFQYAQNRKAYLSRKQLENLSYRDPLTGVFNRNTLREHTGKMSADTLFFFGIADVDGFKAVNDTWGHDVGDGCLCAIAELLGKKFGAFIYRYGGDEFVVITHRKEAEIRRVFDEINRTLEERYPGKNVRVSAGFYRPVRAGETYTEIFKRADSALYRSKTTGKAKVSFYNAERENN